MSVRIVFLLWPKEIKEEISAALPKTEVPQTCELHAERGRVGLTDVEGLQRRSLKVLSKRFES